LAGCLVVWPQNEGTQQGRQLSALQVRSSCFPYSLRLKTV
jgi:hypothetical protein